LAFGNFANKANEKANPGHLRCQGGAKPRIQKIISDKLVMDSRVAESLKITRFSAFYFHWLLKTFLKQK